jgi:hypothetical protein
VQVIIQLLQSKKMEHSGCGVAVRTVSWATTQLQQNPVQFKQFLVERIGEAPVVHQDMHPQQSKPMEHSGCGATAVAAGLVIIQLMFILAQYKQSLAERTGEVLV